MPQEIRRTKTGRPYVMLPDGSKEVTYTRASTLAGALDDTYRLMLWKQRKTALGVVERQDIQVAIAAHRDDDRELDKLCEAALVHAKGDESSRRGTALHKLCDRLDSGERGVFVPEAFRADLHAYQKTREEAGFTPRYIEEFVVNDSLKAAGSPDRYDLYEGPTPDGEWYEGYITTDLKTGKEVVRKQLKHGIQLCIYADAEFYHQELQQRKPLPDVNKRWAVITHVPAGSGECFLHWHNIEKVREEYIPIALGVRKARSEKNIIVPMTVNT